MSNIALSTNDHTAAILEPEKKLWYEVILKARDDLQPDVPLNDCSFQWFVSKRFEGGSFLWVCFHLDLDPACVIRAFAKDLRRHLV